MKKQLIAVCLGLAASLQASTVTFDSGLPSGITASANVIYTSTSGPHLWLNDGLRDDYLYFGSPTFVNSFDMNAYRFSPEWTVSLPTGFTMDIEAYAGTTKVWNTQVNLAGYTDWSKWLTVGVNAGGITSLRFLAPNVGLNAHTLSPSIDNLVINQETRVNNVPDSTGAATLLAIGLGALAITRGAVKRQTISL